MSTRAHRHSSPRAREHTLSELISSCTLRCRTYPASRWVDVFTPTLSRLRDICLLAWHSSDLLPPGTFPVSFEKPVLPHTWLCPSLQAEWGIAVPQACNMLSSECVACSVGTEGKAYQNILLSNKCLFWWTSYIVTVVPYNSFKSVFENYVLWFNSRVL